MPNEILIEVAYALPKKQLIIPVKVKQGITAEEAIKLSGITKKFPEIDLGVNQIGIFGKLTQLDHVMRERDRIEIYRPLELRCAKARLRMWPNQDEPTCQIQLLAQSLQWLNHQSQYLRRKRSLIQLVQLLLILENLEHR